MMESNRLNRSRAGGVQLSALLGSVKGYGRVKENSWQFDGILSFISGLESVLTFIEALLRLGKKVVGGLCIRVIWTLHLFFMFLVWLA